MKRTFPMVIAALSILSFVFAAISQGRVPAATVSITTKSAAARERYHNGRDLLDNVRNSEGIAALKQAIELDPDFALAHAYLGSVLPGNEGLKELEAASALSTR